MELPLSDGLLITDIADINLVSGWVVLDSEASVSDHKNAPFISLAIGTHKAKTVRIKDNKSKIKLSKNAKKDKISLSLNMANLPDALRIFGALSIF